MTEIQILQSGTVTATGAGTGVPTPRGLKVAAQIEVSAVTGTTPSYTFALQWSNDLVNWCDADPAEPFAAITAAKNVAKAFDPKALYVRLAWTVTGTTPSATVQAQINGVDDD